MICEKILGTISDIRYHHLYKVFVNIEWYDVHNRLNRSHSSEGEDIGIRLQGTDLVRGLKHGDVLYADDKKVIVVNIPEYEVIQAIVAPNAPAALAKLCYQIGNTHALLLQGENAYTFYMCYTPYYASLLENLRKIENIQIQIVKKRIDKNDAFCDSMLCL